MPVDESLLLSKAPDSITIYHAGTSFINGTYKLQRLQSSGSPMLKYTRECLHPLSNVPFCLEIVQKNIPVLSRPGSVLFLLQGYRISSPSSPIIYYISHKHKDSTSWSAMAGLSPLPKMSLKPFSTLSNVKNHVAKDSNDQTDSNASKSASKSACKSVYNTFERYLEDTYLFRFASDCRVLRTGRDSTRGDFLVLNDTIFHPQGGGQPSDVGCIKSPHKVAKSSKSSKSPKSFEKSPKCPKSLEKSLKFPEISDKVCEGSFCFNVTFVCREDGEIRHYGSYTQLETTGTNTNGARECFGAGDCVVLEVDQSARELNARCHSAGHLLDIGMSLIGFGADKMVPAKGYHFAKGAYVEYVGNIEAPQREKVRSALEQKVNELILEAMDSRVMLLDSEQYGKMCVRGWNSMNVVEREKALQGLRTNMHGKVRVVAWDEKKIENVADAVVVDKSEMSCMCGGTHVDNSKRVGKIVIGKFKKKGKNLRIPYVVQES